MIYGFRIEVGGLCSLSLFFARLFFKDLFSLLVNPKGIVLNNNLVLGPAYYDIGVACFRTWLTLRGSTLSGTFYLANLLFLSRVFFNCWQFLLALVVNRTHLIIFILYFAYLWLKIILILHIGIHPSLILSEPIIHVFHFVRWESFFHKKLDKLLRVISCKNEIALKKLLVRVKVS